MFDRLKARIYSTIKGFVVVVVLGTSIPVMLGYAANPPARYVVGAILIASGVFAAIDVWGMSSELKKLETENDRLSASNQVLTVNITNMNTSLNKLQLETAMIQDTNKKLTATSDALQLQNNDFASQNNDLKQSITRYSKLISQLQDQIKSMELQSKKLESVTAEQTRQIDSLRLVQNQSKQLIAALMTAGDDFKNFNSTLIESIEKIENTSDAMTVLLDKLATSEFNTIDVNDDGTISKEELITWAFKSKS